MSQLTLEQLEAQINTNVLSNWGIFNNTLPELKKIYKALKADVPQLPLINFEIHNGKASIEAIANDILSSYAIHLFNVAIGKGADREAEAAKLNAYLYAKNWNEFFQLIQLETEIHATTESPKTVQPAKVIYNTDKYDDDLTIHKFYDAEKGSPLQFDADSPISYVVNLPPGEVKGIQVSAYGGFNRKDRKKQLHVPGQISVEDQVLLAKGIAVVYLNLPDLLKSDTYQLKMSEPLHTEIHACINRFWEVLSKTPEQLSPKLLALKDKPIVLQGASWGGRTAVRHAQLYPNTFNRYISYQGALSSDMLHHSSRRIAGYKEKQLKHLDPAAHIDDLVDPVLLIHNADDNNVNLKVSLDFYEQAKSKGKASLLSIHINEKGNPYEWQTGRWNTGHFPPSFQTSAFKAQTNAVSAFILNEPGKIPEFSSWRAFRYETISDRNYLKATSSDQFVEYVFRQYTKSKKLPSIAELSRIFYVLKFIEECPDFLLLQILNPPFTKETLARGISTFFDRLSLFYKEKYGISLPPANEFSSTLLDQYQESILRANKQDHRELLLSIIFANPEYVEKIYQYCASLPDYASEQINAYAKLNSFLAEHKEKTTDLFRTTVTAAIKDAKNIAIKIRRGDHKAFIGLIKTYNNADTQKLRSRINEILNGMSEAEIKLLFYNASQVIITDTSVQNKIFAVMLEYLDYDDFLNVVRENLSPIKELTSRWRSDDDRKRFLLICKKLKPEHKSELLSIKVLQNIPTGEILQALTAEIRDDELFNLFHQTDGLQTPLTYIHEVSFLNYLKERVGEVTFKQLLRFEIDGKQGSVLKDYITDNESFAFICSHLDNQEMLEHVYNSAIITSYQNNLLAHIVEMQQLTSFETVVSKLAPHEINNLLTEEDQSGYSALRQAIGSYVRSGVMSQEFVAKAKQLLLHIIRYLSPRILADEFSSSHSEFPLFLRNCLLKDPELLNTVKQTLGDILFLEVLEKNIDNILNLWLQFPIPELEDFLLEFFTKEDISSYINSNLSTILQLSINKEGIDLVRKYANSAETDVRILETCVENVKDNLDVAPAGAQPLETLRHLKWLSSSDYIMLEQLLNQSPNSLVSLLQLNQNQKADPENLVSKIRALANAPDEMIPYIFSWQFLIAALNNNSKSTIIEALNNINHGKNLSVVYHILNETDKWLVQFLKHSTADNLDLCFRFANADQISFLSNLLAVLPPITQKNLFSVNVLRSIKNGEILSKVLRQLSDDDVFTLFNQVANNTTPLNGKHDLSFLKIVKERVGPIRFKQLLRFQREHAKHESVLQPYISDPECFAFLCSHLDADELLTHISDYAKTSSYQNNLLAHIVEICHLPSFEIVIKQLDQAAINQLLVQKDRDGYTAIRQAIGTYVRSAPNANDLLRKMLDFLSAEDLAEELMSSNNEFGLLLLTSLTKDPTLLDAIQNKLGNKLFADIMHANVANIKKLWLHWRSPAIDSFLQKYIPKAEMGAYIDSNIVEILQGEFNKTLIDRVRQFSNITDINEQILKAYAKSIKAGINNNNPQTALQPIADCIQSSEFSKIQAYLNQEPAPISAIFSIETLQTTEPIILMKKVQHMLSFPDKLIPVIFNHETIKQIINLRMERVILSYFDIYQIKGNAEVLYNTLELAMLHADYAKCILQPSAEAVLNFLQNNDYVKWEVAFATIDTADIKRILTPMVLKAISNPLILNQALARLNDEDIAQLFLDADARKVLKDFSNPMLQVITDRIGNQRLTSLISLPDNSTRSSLIFSPTKTIESEDLSSNNNKQVAKIIKKPGKKHRDF